MQDSLAPEGMRACMVAGAPRAVERGDFRRDVVERDDNLGWCGNE